jgi:hypothetical protein
MADEIGVDRPERRLPVPRVPIAAVLLVFGSVGYGLWRVRGAGQLTNCQSNLITLTSAIGLYRDQHKGRLPASLDELKSRMRSIPTCPAAGRNTYAYVTAGNELTVYCKGDYHHYFLPGPETVDHPREPP